jgi:hypothetical protein
VIRREQYELRTPWDDPTVRHGPGNPGRSLYIIGLQLINYLQYCDWQWAKASSRRDSRPRGASSLSGTLVNARLLPGLVLMGFSAQSRADRSGAWLLGILWLTTGSAWWPT